MPSTRHERLLLSREATNTAQVVPAHDEKGHQPDNRGSDPPGAGTVEVNDHKDHNERSDAQQTHPKAKIPTIPRVAPIVRRGVTETTREPHSQNIMLDLVDNWPTDRPRPMRQNRALGYALNAICNWLPGTAVGWRHDADPGANSSQRMRGRQIRPVVGLGVQPAMTRA